MVGDKNTMQLDQNHSVQRGAGLQKEGYTLVEVLCAIVVASIAASALFVGFDNGFAVLRTTREDLRATQILMQKTEAVRLLTWNQLTNVTGKFTEYYYQAGTLTTNRGTLFVGNFSTLGVPATIPDTVSYKSQLHLITVTLQWTNYVGATAIPHSRSMQTLSALNGLQNYVYGAGNTN
jgi:prepilin-type N-terminal cleavage/methylation domain-containing protein